MTTLAPGSPRCIGWRCLVVAGALTIAACGGSDSAGEAAPTAAAEPPAAGSEPVDAAPATTVTSGEGGLAALDFFGSAVELSDGPVTLTADGEEQIATMASGASVTVPAGAFDAPTDVVVTEARLGFDTVVQSAPNATAIVVSSEPADQLAAPVVVDIPVTSPDTTVVVLEDDTWVTVAHDDSTARVELRHFSDRVIAVSEGSAAGAPPPTGDDPDESPAQFLRLCIGAVYLMYGGEAADEADDDEAARFSGDLAFSVCTRALIDRLSPTGERVTTECVGDKIGGDVDIRGAIDQCIADQNEETTGEEPTSDSVTEESDADPVPVLMDGTYTNDGQTPFIWPGGIFVVDDEQVVVTISGGRLVDFVFVRRATYIIPKADTDGPTDETCTINAFLDWSGDPATSRNVATPDAAIEIDGEFSYRYEFPDCERRLVPFEFGPNGDDSIDDTPLTFRITQSDGGVALDDLRSENGPLIDLYAT